MLELTLPELINLYGREKPSRTVVGERERKYRVRFWEQHTRELSAWDINPDQITGLVDVMTKAGYQGSTINRHMVEAKAAYNWAIKHRHTPDGFVTPFMTFQRLPVRKNSIPTRASNFFSSTVW